MSTLLDTLWQGMLVTAVMAAILKFMPRLNAATRYACWWLPFIAIVMLPLRAINLPASRPSAAATKRLPVALTTDIAAAPAPRLDAKTPNTVFAHTPAARQFESSEGGIQIHLNAKPIVAGVTAVWGSATLVLLVRLALSYRSLCRLKRLAAPAAPDLQARLRALRSNAAVRRDVRLLTSDDVTSPMVLGLFNPAIVIPRSLLTQLSEADFDHVALHELAHLRRYDDWMNLLQKLLQAMLPIQPGIYWIDRQLTLERETACDDWVIGFAEKPKHYAATLTRVAELTLWSASGVLCAGVAGAPSQLYRRVQRLLDTTRNVATRVSRKSLAAATVVVAVLTVGVFHTPPLFALTNAAEPASPAAQPGDTTRAEAATLTRSFDVEPGGSLLLSVERGNVKVVPWERKVVQIVVTRGGRGAEEILKHHQFAVAQAGRMLILHAEFEKGSPVADSTAITYEIKAPKKFGLQLATGDGSVEVSNMAGSVDGRTELGDIDIKDFFGPSLHASTREGRVFASLNGACKTDSLLHSDSGDVTVDLPSNSALNLTAVANLGGFDSQFPGAVQAQDGGTETTRLNLNGGGPSLRLEAKSGRVHVKKR